MCVCGICRRHRLTLLASRDLPDGSEATVDEDITLGGQGPECAIEATFDGEVRELLGQRVGGAGATHWIHCPRRATERVWPLLLLPSPVWGTRRKRKLREPAWPSIWSGKGAMMFAGRGPAATTSLLSAIARTRVGSIALVLRPFSAGCSRA